MAHVFDAIMTVSAIVGVAVMVVLFWFLIVWLALEAACGLGACA